MDAESLSRLDLLCSLRVWFSEDLHHFPLCFWQTSRHRLDTPRLPELEGIMWAQAAPEVLGPDSIRSSGVHCLPYIVSQTWGSPVSLCFWVQDSVRIAGGDC